VEGNRSGGKNSPSTPPRAKGYEADCSLLGHQRRFKRRPPTPRAVIRLARPQGLGSECDSGGRSPCSSEEAWPLVIALQSRLESR
jgi:hypothetical protein